MKGGLILKKGVMDHCSASSTHVVGILYVFVLLKGFRDALPFGRRPPPAASQHPPSSLCVFSCYVGPNRVGKDRSLGDENWRAME